MGSNKKSQGLLSTGFARAASLFFVALFICASNSSAWTMKKANLMTRWSMDTLGNVVLFPSAAWPQHPRPGMKRPALWQNLNGIWQYQSSTGATEAVPTGNLSGDILVPFPIESAISGVMSYPAPVYSWYRLNFTLAANLLPIANKRILLHFESVDWQTQVYVNNATTPLLTHQGGYDRFTVDITSSLINNGTGTQVVTLHVYDPTENGYQPIGKQRTPTGAGHIWYTSTTGIWKTVWLEAVPATAYINTIKLLPDPTNSQLKITSTLAGSSTTGAKIVAIARDPKTANQCLCYGIDTANATDTCMLKLSAVNYWWPDRPYLYNLSLYLLQNNVIVDSVQSYFAMRSVTSPVVSSQRLFYLNGQRMFLYGTLDQGFWPDGIYTPPSYAAVVNDLNTHKSVGMNGLRKHIKVESDLYYYLCDSLGIMVEQDMPAMFNATAAAESSWAAGIDSLVTQNYNHPSIVMWIVFNECWGLWGEAANAARIMAMDPSRLVNCNSGENLCSGGFSGGMVYDVHNYTPPASQGANATYVIQDGEYGGIHEDLASKNTGHMWWPTNCSGYSTATSDAAYDQTLVGFCNTLKTERNTYGLSGGVYTQISDVEAECNGLLSYDRYVQHGIADTLKKAGDSIVYHPTPAPLVAPTMSICTGIYQGSAKEAPVNVHVSIASITRNAITVVVEGNGPSTLRMINTRGQTVFTTNVVGTRTLTIKAAGMARGLYFLELKNGAVAQRLRVAL